MERVGDEEIYYEEEGEWQYAVWQQECNRQTSMAPVSGDWGLMLALALFEGVERFRLTNKSHLE